MSRQFMGKKEKTQNFLFHAKEITAFLPKSFQVYNMSFKSYGTSSLVINAPDFFIRDFYFMFFILSCNFLEMIRLF